jgi:hypothetical protein
VIEREDLDGNPNGFAIHVSKLLSQPNYFRHDLHASIYLKVNDGHSPVWYLRAESSRDKKSWLMRLAHVHAIVKWVSFRLLAK